MVAQTNASFSIGKLPTIMHAVLGCNRLVYNWSLSIPYSSSKFAPVVFLGGGGKSGFKHFQNGVFDLPRQLHVRVNFPM